jgi:hypothetical protein
MDVTSPYLACNIDGSLATPGYHAQIQAGTEVIAHYDKNFTIPGEERASPSECWGHAWGPMIAYMAACNGPCDTVDPAAASWFKIFETGLLGGNLISENWEMSSMHNNCTPFVLTIPEYLKPGNYLLRHEVIAIHNTPSQLQLYMECAQVEILGSGSSLPTEEYLVKFPGAYSMSGMFVCFVSCRSSSTN